MAKKTEAPKKVNYNEASKAELEKALSEKTADLSTTIRSFKSGELVNPRSLGALKKEIARIKTALRAHELKESK